jgi:hypothetical protein
MPAMSKDCLMLHIENMKKLQGLLDYFRSDEFRKELNAMSHDERMAFNTEMNEAEEVLYQLDVMIDRIERFYPSRLPGNVPVGYVLVHNIVKPARRQGTRGFRYWLQAPADNLEICPCRWAPELPQHYRVKRIPERD